MLKPPFCFTLFIIELLFFTLGLKYDAILIILLPAVIIFAITLIYHPAIALLILAIIPMFKIFLNEMWAGFEIYDPTVILTAIVWLGIIQKKIELKLKIPKNLYSLIYAHLLFSIIVLMSMFYTPSPEYGVIKTFKFIVFNTTLFIAPMFLVNSTNFSKVLANWFLGALILVSIVMIGQFIYALQSGQLMQLIVRLSLLGSNPIQVSRLLSIGVAFLIILSQSKGYVLKISVVLLLLVFFTVLLSTGTRGPLVSIFIGVTLYIILIHDEYKNKTINNIILSMMIVVVALLVLPESITNRYFILDYKGEFGIEGDAIKRVNTVETRFTFWKMSLITWVSSIKNFIFGLGFGGFSSLFIWRDFRWYPHNIFFETIVELGVIGLVSLMTFFSIAAYIVIKNARKVYLSEASKMWILATLVMFVNIQFSSDLADNRIFWMLLSLALISTECDASRKERLD